MQKMLCAYNLRPAQFKLLNWKMIEPDKDGSIYWHIVNFTPDQPKEKTVEAFTEAFAIWQNAFDKVPPEGRVIEFKPTSDFHKAHIRLFFMQPKTRVQEYIISDGTRYKLLNEWPFDGELGVLAHRPPNKHELHFDESESWSDIHKWEKSGDKWKLMVKLMAVALHEIGHLVDLDHSNDAKALMAAMYDGTRVTIQDDDQRGLNQKWAPIKKRIAASMPAKVEQVDGRGDLLLAAFKYYGMKEVSGPESEPTILSIIQKVFPSALDDSKVPWCSVFMNWLAWETGHEAPSSNVGLAKSWLKVGREIPISQREIGDIIVFHRGKNPALGHVGIYINERGHMVRVVGGNQDDAVNIRSYPASRIAGVRRLSKLI